MPSNSIYPAIPMPGKDPSTYLPALEAMRQVINLIVLNGLSPNPNYTPSQAAQIFVTNAILARGGFIPLGKPAFSALPVNAANDAAAAAAGVPINGIYRNGSVLMVRVA